MFRAVVALVVALAVFSLVGSAHGDPTRTLSLGSLSSLSWKPHSEPVHDNNRLLGRADDERVARVYVGPILVEGKSALLVQQLPSGLVRSLASPVGISPLFLSDGVGLSVYGRFDRR